MGIGLSVFLIAVGAILTGQLHVDEGSSAKILGMNLATIKNRSLPRLRRNLGVVYQDYKLLDELSVYDNVAFALHVLGTRKSAIRPMVEDALDIVGLSGKEDQKPGTISGGEAQRVAIARAIVGRPKILLADEPTGNLDPATGDGIMDIIDKVNKKGTTVIMATHARTIVDLRRQRVLQLKGGKLIRDEIAGSYLGYEQTAIEAR